MLVLIVKLYRKKGKYAKTNGHKFYLAAFFERKGERERERICIAINAAARLYTVLFSSRNYSIIIADYEN